MKQVCTRDITETLQRLQRIQRLVLLLCFGCSIYFFGWKPVCRQPSWITVTLCWLIVPCLHIARGFVSWCVVWDLALADSLSAWRVRFSLQAAASPVCCTWSQDLHAQCFLKSSISWLWLQPAWASSSLLQPDIKESARSRDWEYYIHPELASQLPV